jgi:chromosome segregation ATPase
MTMSRTLAFLAIALLTVAGVATVVAAQDGKGPGDHPKAAERKEAAKEKAAAARDNATAKAEERCAELNGTLNDSQQMRCMKVKEFADHAFKARREAHALIGAIGALERRIGRLEVREHVLQAELDSGNFTGNDTAESVQAEIDQIQEHQDQMVDRVLHLRERLEALHEKWQSVREHVADVRHKGEADDGDLPDDGSDSDESLSESATETSSSSSSSSAAA